MSSPLRRPLQVKPFEALRSSVMAATLAALIALVGGQHAAANASTTTATATATATDDGAIKPPAPKKKKSSRPKIYKGSGESTAERDRRLYRECKGRPNAGACEGYAR